jgi:L,D-transpeptidase-like protein
MTGESTGRHAKIPRRAAVWLTAMAVSALAVIVAAIWLVVSVVAGATAGDTAPARTAAPVSRYGGASAAPISWTPVSPPVTPRSPAHSGNGLALSPHDRRSCRPAASACADLSDHLTWLQSDGQIIYGPVHMEPGTSADPTPRGIFHVAWKAGAHYISTSFGVPIPYAVFFAPGGIAFHAGSLSSSSHGCIHLTLHNAHYYHDHLPIGAEVDVF